jgi:hypothetical protein
MVKTVGNKVEVAGQGMKYLFDNDKKILEAVEGRPGDENGYAS